MSSENREETADKLGTLKKWQVVADIIAKLAVPVALAFVSYMVTASMKEQDVRVKMTEVALDVLKEAPNPKATEADEALRRWAVDLIDTYSSVKLPQSVRAQLAVNAFPSGYSTLGSLVDGPDVRQLLSRVALSGGPEDPNAESWATPHGKSAKSRLPPLEGRWAGRWNRFADANIWHVGEASMLVHGDYFLLVYNDPDSEFLMIDQQDHEGRLVGRHYAINNFRDSSPWVGILVDGTRIDGQWRYGRWDFRRVEPANEREITAARSRGSNLGLNSIRARQPEPGALDFQARSGAAEDDPEAVLGSVEGPTEPDR